MHIMSTNFAKTLVWKHEYDVKLWCHKDRTPQTIDHHMPLNETHPMKIFCVRHCSRHLWKRMCGATDSFASPDIRPRLYIFYKCGQWFAHLFISHSDQP